MTDATSADGQHFLTAAVDRQVWFIDPQTSGTREMDRAEAWLRGGNVLGLVVREGEATGQLLWSWTPSSDSVASTPTNVYNVIATRNLVFFSAVNATASTGATWAVDLNTRQQAWMTQRGGPIAISANRKLYIVSKRPNTLQDIDDQLVQIRLQ